jgi:tRNA-specific 2-thiouridylase
MGRRVVLAMSGGVDSSVAAHLLQAQGYEVIGLFMRTGAHGVDAERRARTCCSASDAIDAQNVADRLDIPFYALDFERDFARIMDQFADEYAAGRTPNPCVMCNIWLKFGKLWSYGKQVGADFVATGHYARIARAPDGTTRVARAVDRAKDQSYVLFGLRRELLPHVLFPVGDYPKAEIRAIARERGLPVHDKPDSQEICFVPDDDYLGFVRARRPGNDTSGAIVDEDGTVLAQHSGIEAFTIGQRRGLGIAVGEPRYVVQIEPVSRTVTVGRRGSLDKGGLEASEMNWQGPTLDGPSRCFAQIRAQHRAVPATVEPMVGARARVLFDEPQPAITPGQVVTLYQDDLVFGGGWIERGIDRPVEAASP